MEIRNIHGDLIFDYDKPDATLVETLAQAVESGTSLNSALLPYVNISGSSLSNVDLQYADLKGANLTDADLRGANLANADLRGANLNSACLKKVNLIEARLDKADLSGADLSEALLLSASMRNVNFFGADLSRSYLTEADLSFSTLTRVDLCDSNLTNTTLSGVDFLKVNLYGANLNRAVIYNARNFCVPMSCPSDGAFIAWKKVTDIKDGLTYLVKLLVPEDARRSSATSEKCRCDKAMVLAINNIITGESVNEVINLFFSDTKYVVGVMVYPDSFDDNRWNECSNGIHFFVDREMAINYIV